MDDPESENPAGLQNEIAPCPAKPHWPNTLCAPQMPASLQLCGLILFQDPPKTQREEILFISFPCPLTLKTLGF